MPASGGASTAGAPRRAPPASAGGARPATLPCGHHSGAPAARRAWCVARPPNFTGETTPSPAAQVRRQPSTRASSSATMKPRHRRGPVDRGSDDPRHGEDTLDVEALTGGLEHQAVAVLACHDAGVECYARPPQLFGHRLARLVAEQPQRCVFRRDDRDADVVLTHLAGPRPRSSGRVRRRSAARRPRAAPRPRAGSRSRPRGRGADRRSSRSHGPATTSSRPRHRPPHARRERAAARRTRESRRRPAGPGRPRRRPPQRDRAPAPRRSLPQSE